MTQSTERGDPGRGWIRPLRDDEELFASLGRRHADGPNALTGPLIDTLNTAARSSVDREPLISTALSGALALGSYAEFCAGETAGKTADEAFVADLRSVFETRLDQVSTAPDGGSGALSLPPPDTACANAFVDALNDMTETAGVPREWALQAGAMALARYVSFAASRTGVSTAALGALAMDVVAEQFTASRRPAGTTG